MWEITSYQRMDTRSGLRGNVEEDVREGNRRVKRRKKTGKDTEVETRKAVILSHFRLASCWREKWTVGEKREVQGNVRRERPKVHVRRKSGGYRSRGCLTLSKWEETVMTHWFYPSYWTQHIKPVGVNVFVFELFFTSFSNCELNWMRKGRKKTPKHFL